MTGGCIVRVLQCEGGGCTATGHQHCQACAQPRHCLYLAMHITISHPNPSTDHHIHLQLTAQLRRAEEETSFCHTLKCGRGTRDFHATVVYCSYIQCNVLHVLIIMKPSGGKVVVM